MKSTILISLTICFLQNINAADYPAPQPPKDISEYGKHIQRSMTLMETSSPEKQNTIKILFYGQSIMGHQWHTMVAEDLKARYPHTEFIIKNKALGGFSSQRLVRTTEYDVIPFYPDLLVFHVYGDHNKYEDIIHTVRSRTTAEVIMQSDHANKWPQPKVEENFWVNQKVWEDKMNFFLLPAIAEKFNCAWQPQRWEWVDYLKNNNMQPKDLLTDGVHLNEHGQWLMAELLKRFLVYLPEVPDTEWEDLVTTYEVGKDVHWQDGKLTLPFEGNRVEAIAGDAQHGSAKVYIDNKPPGEHPECMTFTRPSETPGAGWPGIMKISWETALIEERWTATLSNFNEDQDDFDFTIEGSKTGPDGKGNSKEHFVSDSGRVVIEPEDWVFAYDKKVRDVSAADGYKVTWQSQLMGTDIYVSPEASNPAQESTVLLASDLTNEIHTLVLDAKEMSIPDIKEIKVYRPMYK